MMNDMFVRLSALGIRAIASLRSRRGRDSLMGGLLPAGIAICLATGCETLTSTTLEENAGEYREARSFLVTGKTTQAEVREKYGEPVLRKTLDDGNEYWLYRKKEAVILNAYTNTPVGTQRSIMGEYSGYQHTIDRTSVMELFFSPDGVLVYYRLDRGLK